MSGTAGGTIGLKISPEAADPNSVLGIVRGGDMVTCDVESRLLHVHLSDAEISRRIEKRRTASAPSPWEARERITGYQGLYMRSVNQAQHGADFDFLTAREPS
ncbi:Putative dehydratase IlvD1 [Tolypocladium paradoxum]|uniref:Dehydratase IlvD1 n=1 Tax=Tolypocladium paradoxum TaxID=94208 RepID=A0A2S4KRI7_9HYPO|nr:Putative dehydratase IlvD1 [Tolypocladium paradoxum]